jgi:hypothetical protein
MARFARSYVALSAVWAFLVSVEAAHALCQVPIADYQDGGGGTFGAYAVTEGTGCSNVGSQGGGTGSTTAAASSSYFTLSGAGPFLLSSTADLASGALTAYSEAASASSSIWDSFTYAGLPSGHATITATLSLNGTLTGLSSGMARVQEGAPDNLTLDNTVFFNNATHESIPPSVPLSFDATDGDQITVFAFIQVFGDSSGGIGNLGDVPTLALTLPQGASVVTASGIFSNFVAPIVPEPSTWAMMLLGFAALGCAAYRRPRHARLATLA